MSSSPPLPPFPIGPNTEPLEYLHQRGRTDDDVSAVASAMYLAKCFFETQPQLRVLMGWFRADQGLLAKLPQVQGGTKGELPLQERAAHEGIPQRLAQALRPLMELEAAIRDLRQVMERLAGIVDVLEQPQYASLLSKNRKKQMMVAFADATTRALGIQQFGATELAAVSVLMGEDAPSSNRNETALTSCVERWRNARQEAKELRGLLLQLLDGGTQQADMSTSSGASPMEEGRPATDMPTASPSSAETTGKTE